MKIAMLGDTVFSKKTVSEYKKILKQVKDKLAHFDLVICNLEAPIIDEGVSSNRSVCLSITTKHIEILKYLGVDVVCLSNNHIYDYGKDGYLNTLKMLKEHGIGYFGVEDKSYVLENEKIAIHGFCSFDADPSLDLLSVTSRQVNSLSLDIVLQVMNEYSDKGYFNILSIHAGDENVNYPRKEYIEFARKIAECQDFIYYGHHPHVIQGFEKVNESLIAYSLGNFYFEDIIDPRTNQVLIKQSEENNSSFIFGVNVDGGKVVDYEIIPFVRGFDGHIEFDNNSVLEKISNYSSSLNLDDYSYNELREQQLKEHTKNLQSKRGVHWFLSRLSYKTVLRRLEHLKNKKLYKTEFKNKLESDKYG